MDKLELVDFPDWHGDVALYRLPSTKTSFRSDLAALLLPHVPANQALLLVQQTHLGGQTHDHLDDHLVILHSIDEDGKSILGILTRCWRCIDLWLPVRAGNQLANIDDLLEKSEEEGTLEWLEKAKAQTEAASTWFAKAQEVTRPAYWSVARQYDPSVAPLRLRGTAVGDEEVP